MRFKDLRIKYKLDHNQMKQCIRAALGSEYLKNFSLFNEPTNEEEEKLVKLLEYKKYKRERLAKMVKLMAKGELARSLEKGLL
jgi:hypothetical protein